MLSGTSLAFIWPSDRLHDTIAFVLQGLSRAGSPRREVGWNCLFL